MEEEMKEWPKNDEPVLLQDIVKPLRASVRFGYRLKRIKRNRDVPWTGLNLGAEELATSERPNKCFSAPYFAEQKRRFDRRSLIDEILTTAVQLGIEQGRRLEKKNVMREKKTTVKTGTR